VLTDIGETSLSVDLTSGQAPALGTEIECATKLDHEVLSFTTTVLEETATPAPGLTLAKPTAVERQALRRVPRVSTQLPTTYRSYQDSGPDPHPLVEATVIDLSRDGALLAAPSNPESDRLCLRLALPTGLSTDVECVVRNIRPITEGSESVLVGVEFALIEPGAKVDIDFFVAASELRRRTKG